MLVYNNIDLYARTIMIQVNIGLIIIYRIYMAHFTFYKMPHDFKMICRSSLIDCTTFGLMVFAFYGDILLCPIPIHDYINITDGNLEMEITDGASYIIDRESGNLYVDV